MSMTAIMIIEKAIDDTVDDVNGGTPLDPDIDTITIVVFSLTFGEHFI